MTSRSSDDRRYTIVSFHAHPDDEALLTAGTLARAAAEGHRVVIVVATDGQAGLTGAGVSGQELARLRRAELTASAAAIGAERVHHLGYRDSGFDPRLSGQTQRLLPDSFATQDVTIIAAQLLEILRQERADVLTIYDPRGGYGHPDHVQVHRIGLLAASLAGTPVVLEATLDRDRLLKAIGLLRRLRRIIGLPAMPDLTGAYTPVGELTHRVDVRAHLGAKRRSLQAHATQAQGDQSVRTLALLLRLPRPLRRATLRSEWFREIGRAPTDHLLDDIFATLRD